MKRPYPRSLLQFVLNHHGILDGAARVHAVWTDANLERITDLDTSTLDSIQRAQRKGVNIRYGAASSPRTTSHEVIVFIAAPTLLTTKPVPKRLEERPTHYRER